MFDAAGRYMDGKSATALDVTVSHMHESLWIHGDGVRLESWPLEDIRCVEKMNGGAGARLRCIGTPDARLVIHNSEDLAALESVCPNLYRRDSSTLIFLRSVVLWGGLAAASLFFIFYVAIPQFSDRIARVIPQETEDALGAVVEKQILAVAARSSGGPARICRTPEGVAALNKVIAGLSRGLEDGLEPTVIIVESPIKNAVAIPGARVIVFSGLFDLTDHPNSFAGVLAHEFGHIAARHPLRLTIERGAASVLFGLLIGDVFGGSVIAGAGQLALSAAYSRELEREADMAALSLMRAAGWNSRAFAGFFEKLMQEFGSGSRSSVIALLATHPPTPERVAAIRAQTGEGGGSALGDTDWRALKRICAA